MDWMKMTTIHAFSFLFFLAACSSGPTVKNSVKGGLEKGVVDSVIKENISEVRGCYEAQLASHPQLKGRVVTNFTIADNGRVSAANITESTLKNPGTETCLLDVILDMDFPPPVGGGKVDVKYPFIFSPAAE
jgi:TonB family protein